MRSLSVLATFLFLPQAFAGPQRTFTCASCHTQAKTQPLTSMAHALRFAKDNPLFRTHPSLAVNKEQFTYSIETRGGQTTYSVSDGTHKISAPVHWAFGDGSQTYVLERDGHFYESLVSYYPAIDGLDTTMGDQMIHPQTVEQAFGRPLQAIEYTACFECHSTGSVVDHNLSLDSLKPGVTCEHCHAGAGAHLDAISHGKINSIPPDLKRLSPEDVSIFCGQCHRSWETVVRNRLHGKVDVRFQPYRLELSKCFDGTDRRLSCIACHDPHVQVIRDDKSYDAKCLACHSTGAKLSLGMTAAHPRATSMPVCSVAKANCVSCHMPKVQLPGGHQAFTDHDIRIARAGEGYPD